MALKTYTQEATLSANIVLKLTVTEDSTDTSTNKSSCTATLQLILTNQAQFSAAYVAYALSGDTSASGGGGSASYSQGTHTLLTKTYTKRHGTDGTGSTSVTGNIYIPAFGWNVDITASGALTPIPRYATVTSSYSNLQETSVKISWSSDANIEIAQYRLNGGSWVNAQTGLNTKKGNYTITGLSANTNYTIDFDYKRKDSGLWSYSAGKSNSISIKTYQYPYVKSIVTSDLNVGASTLNQTFKLYNQLNRNATVYMKLADNTVINCGSTTNGTDVAYTYTFTTANKNAMNSSITNTTLTKNATYYCTYSSQTVSTVSGKYHINSNDANYKPTFSTSNWYYTTNYVKNDTVVANKSTITVSVNTTATPKTGATITGYTIKWGNQTKTITGTTGSVSVPTDSSTTLKVSANDSRGFSTETSMTIPVLSYSDPTCTIDADRTDGVSSDVFLTLSGSYYTGKLYSDASTQVDNTITDIKYATKTISDSNYGSDYNVTFTASDGSISANNFQIYSDGSSTGFTIGTRYDIRIKITDIYGTKIFYGSITDGKIAVDCYQDSNGDYHRGINGLSDDDYALKVYGNINATNGFVGDLTGNADTSTTSANATKWNDLEDDSNTLNTTNTWIPVYSGGKMQHTLRAIWSSKQHTNHGTNKEYLATLSTLSYWNGAYNSSNASNLTYAHQGEIQCKPTNLYNNTNGTTGTVTLSETSANFAYLDIWFKGNNGTIDFVRIFAPNGKSINLHTANSDGTHAWLQFNVCSISAKSITRQGKYELSAHSSGIDGLYTANVYIVRVDGWK